MMRNKPLHTKLRARDLDITKLAKLLNSGQGIGRSHLCQVLAGERPGKETWPLLAKVLTHEEYELAREYADRVRNVRSKTGLPPGLIEARSDFVDEPDRHHG
jgi:hypothetical protein